MILGKKTFQATLGTGGKETLIRLEILFSHHIHGGDINPHHLTIGHNLLALGRIELNQKLIGGLVVDHTGLANLLAPLFTDNGEVGPIRLKLTKALLNLLNHITDSDKVKLIGPQGAHRNEDKGE